MEFIFDTDWSKALEKVKTINNNFFSLARAIATNKKQKLKVTEVEYNFGDSIISDGKLELPNATNYSFGIVLSSTLEVFINVNEQIVPIAILNPGQTFLLSDHFNSASLPLSFKNITAGARSIFLLPKITDSMRFWRLARRYKLSMDMPRTPFDQWYIFKDIAKATKCSWKAKVLLFNNDWLKEENELTKELRNYLLQHELPRPAFFRKKILFHMILAESLKEFKIKTDIHLADTVKHLLAIATGFLPTFTFAQNESMAPIKIIQHAFMHDYKLGYAPHILQPGYCNQKHPCYYSMQIPILLESSPQQRLGKTKLEQLKNIHDLLSKITDRINNHRNEGVFKEFSDFNTLDFNFFDSRVTNDPEIDSSFKIAKFDSVIQNQVDLFKAPFCGTSNFLSQGCISIISKRTDEP